jgi:hypothetical protein
MPNVLYALTEVGRDEDWGLWFMYYGMIEGLSSKAWYSQIWTLCRQPLMCGESDQNCYCKLLHIFIHLSEDQSTYGFDSILLSLSFFYLLTCAIKRRGIVWQCNACWTVWEIVVLLFLQTSEMPSIHLYLGLPWAIYPDDLLCRARDAIWLVCIRTRCPNHFILCLITLPVWN